jgi:hypothetical protein
MSDRAFYLIKAGDPTCVYGLGGIIENEAADVIDVPTVWLDPDTGLPVFGLFTSPDEALAELSGHLRRQIPLEVVMDPRPYEAGLAQRSEEIVLAKARLAA